MDMVFYIVLAIVGFIVFMRLLAWFSSVLKKGKKIAPFSGEIGRKIQRGEKLLLYFYTPTCGACKSMTPVIDQMKEEKNNIYKINLAKDRSIGEVFGVMGTPATVLVKDARIDQYILGARSPKFLNSLTIDSVKNSMKK
jgi:thioredoxin 1